MTFFNLYYKKDSKGKELTAKQLQIRQNLHSSFPTVDKDALDNVLESVRYMDKDFSCFLSRELTSQHKYVEFLKLFLFLIPFEIKGIKVEIMFNIFKIVIFLHWVFLFISSLNYFKNNI